MLVMMVSIVVLNASCDSRCKEGDGFGTRFIDLPQIIGIDFQISGDIVVSEGATQSILVEGSQNVISDITTSVQNEIWQIGLREDCYKSYDMTIYVTVPSLEYVSLSGSGNVTIGELSNTSSLSVDLPGSGTIEVDESQHLLEMLDITIQGSGSYRGFGLSTSKCVVSIPGSGSVEVSVVDQLTVNISGSGSVDYKGSPSVSENIKGSGSVDQAK